MKSYGAGVQCSCAKEDVKSHGGAGPYNLSAGSSLQVPRRQLDNVETEGWRVGRLSASMWMRNMCFPSLLLLPRLLLASSHLPIIAILGVWQGFSASALLG